MGTHGFLIEVKFIPKEYYKFELLRNYITQSKKIIMILLGISCEKFNAQDALSMLKLSSIEDVYYYALKVEEYLGRK
jgi:hypothetical protein